MDFAKDYALPHQACVLNRIWDTEENFIKRAL